MQSPKWVILTSAPLILAGVAAGGDYHKDGTLRCGQCHVMHFSQSHGYQPGGGGNYTSLGSTPQLHLLRDTINNLCLSCHDEEGFAPDVLGSSNGGNGPTDVRLAGYLNRLGSVGLAATGHTLDSQEDAPHGSAGTAWNAGPEGLRCTNCHHQHGYAGSGNNAYRNLVVNPGTAAFGSGLVTYNDTQIGTVDLTKDVFERQQAEYDEGDMDWLEPDNTQSAIGRWCNGCHTDFHGTVGSGPIGGDPGTNHEFIRHPTAGVNIGGQPSGGHSSLTQFLSHTNRVKVMSEIGVWDGSGSTGGADLTPTCVTCHKAHGNGNAFGLIYRSGTGTLTENGDSNGTQLEHLCGQCHVQASSFANP